MVRAHARRGFTQMEIVASTAMLGIVMTATMTSIAASRKRVFFEMNRLQGQALANELLLEILSLPAIDPETGSSDGLGPDSGESDSGDRSKWDDVDDYHGFKESPPKTKEGIDIEGFQFWTRTVLIEPLKSSDWTQVASEYDRALRVTVTVYRDANSSTTAVGYKNGDQENYSPLQGP